MQRNAFLMKLKPGFEAEYKKRHDQIWPELAAELTAAGIFDYSIFLHPPTGYLFAIQKLSPNNNTSSLPQTAIVKKWWAYMQDIMDSHPDNSPIATPLPEVFHMD